MVEKVGIAWSNAGTELTKKCQYKDGIYYKWVKNDSQLQHNMGEACGILESQIQELLADPKFVGIQWRLLSSKVEGRAGSYYYSKDEVLDMRTRKFGDFGLQRFFPSRKDHKVL